MTKYAEDRIKLEETLEETRLFHDMSVRIYNIFKDEFSLDLRDDGRLVCTLNYIKDSNDVYVIPDISNSGIKMSNMLNEDSDEYKISKKVFLYSEIILMSDEILDYFEDFIDSEKYIEFIGKYR